MWSAFLITFLSLLRKQETCFTEDGKSCSRVTHASVKNAGVNLRKKYHKMSHRRPVFGKKASEKRERRKERICKRLDYLHSGSGAWNKTRFETCKLEV
jgi:hypothetical protein